MAPVGRQWAHCVQTMQMLEAAFIRLVLSAELFTGLNSTGTLSNLYFKEDGK